jgi:hypothetical protein
VILAESAGPPYLRDMSFIAYNLQTELKKLAEGKRTKVSHQTLALHALDYVEAVAAQPPDVSFLEKLFALKDTREGSIDRCG